MDQNVADITIEDFFNLQVENAGSRTAVAYRKALASVGQFFASHGYSFSDVCEWSLRCWICQLFVEGHTVATVSYYFDTFAALYGKAVKQQIVSPQPAFKIIKAELRETAKNKFTDCRGAIGQILRMADARKEGELGRLTDFFLCQILQGGASFEYVAGLKESDIDDLTEAAREIVSGRHISSDGYLFDLRQGMLTGSRLSGYLVDKMPFIVQYWGLQPSVDIEDTALNYWIQSALECGIAPEKVAGMVREIPGDCLSLKFVTPAEVPEDEARGIRDVVSSALVANPLKWFAMRLRSKVSKDDITDRISSSGSLGRLVSDFFYPYEEFVRRVDRKLIHRQQPVLPDVLFFRARITDILPLFREIGDLAWCYRGMNNTESSYSVIPDVQMREFQARIRQFTPDFHPVTDPGKCYSCGQMVRITSGPRAGFVGEIVRIGSRANTARFTLKLLGMEFFNWYEELHEWEFETIPSDGGGQCSYSL